VNFRLPVQAFTVYNSSLFSAKVGYPTLSTRPEAT